MFDKRQHYQNPAYRNALLLLLNSDEAPIDCRVIDFSTGGMKLLVSKHVSVGSMVEVLIGDESTIGEVRYSAPRPMGQCEVGVLKRAQES